MQHQRGLGPAVTHTPGQCAEVVQHQRQPLFHRLPRRVGTRRRGQRVSPAGREGGWGDGGSALGEWGSAKDGLGSRQQEAAGTPPEPPYCTRLRVCREPKLVAVPVPMYLQGERWGRGRQGRWAEQSWRRRGGARRAQAQRPSFLHAHEQGHCHELSHGGLHGDAHAARILRHLASACLRGRQRRRSGR